MAVRSKDIAKLLGISTSTVSLVLNNRPGVSAETREKVQNAIYELGFKNEKPQKAELEKNLKLIIYKKHGRVVDDTPFFSELLEGMETEARRSGCNFLISYVSSQENPADISGIIGSGIDGVIILATEMLQEDLQIVKNISLPYVMLDSYFEDETFDTVAINNSQGAYIATKHLIEMGHREIGYLKSITPINNFTERKEGFNKVLDKYNLALNEKYVFGLESNTHGAYSAMREILQNHSEMPTAFFADNDLIAIGALKAFKEAGLRIPEDISIIGFDNMSFCEICEPNLTTVSVPKQMMGMMTVRLIIEKIDSAVNENIKLEVCTKLIERNSVLNRNIQQNKNIKEN